MLEDKVWWIIGGAALLLLIGVFWIFNNVGTTVKHCELTPPPDHVYGIGDATAISESKARIKAKELALDDLVGKLMVKVESDKELKKYIISTESEEETKKTGMESLKLKINLKSVIQVADFQTKECFMEKDGNYYVKVMVYMPQSYAEKLVIAYSYAQAVEALSKNKQYFTAVEFAKRLKVLSLAIQPVPAPIAESSKYIAQAEEGYKKAKAIIAKLETIDVTSPEGYMKYLVYLDELSRTASDVPNFERYVEKIKHSRAVIFDLKGPKYVVKNQKVILKLKTTPTIKGSYKINITSSGGKFPEETYVEDGQAFIEGYVDNNSCSVLVNLSNVVILNWKPDVVYSAKLENVVKVLLSTVERPSSEVIFLPRNWKACDVEAAYHAEKAAIELGWNVVDIERMANDFGKLFPTYETAKFKGATPVYINVESSGAEIFGLKRLRVEVKNWKVENCAADKMEILAKAAIMTKNFDAVIHYQDNYIKAVAYMLKGKFEKALYVLKNSDDGKSILLKAYINYEMGSYKNAVQLSKEVAEDYPDMAYWIMAKSFSKIDGPVYLLKEMRDLYKATRKVKNCHPGYYAAAVLLEKFGNYKEAKEWILKALDIKPDNPEYLYEYAKILHGLKRDDKAKEILAKLSGEDLPMSLKEKVEELLKEIR